MSETFRGLVWVELDTAVMGPRGVPRPEAYGSQPPTITMAAEVPGGCLVRCRGDYTGLAFVPGVRVETVSRGASANAFTHLVPREQVS